MKIKHFPRSVVDLEFFLPTSHVIPGQSYPHTMSIQRHLLDISVVPPPHRKYKCTTSWLKDLGGSGGYFLSTRFCEVKGSDLHVSDCFDDINGRAITSFRTCFACRSIRCGSRCCKWWDQLASRSRTRLDLPIWAIRTSKPISSPPAQRRYGARFWEGVSTG